MTPPIDPLAEELGRHGEELSRASARLDLLEEAKRPNQIDAAVERGLPADWMTAEQNVWKRLSPFHGKWPKVVEFDTRVAEVEMRQAEVLAELNQLRDRAQAAPAAHQQALAEWQLGGQQGPRPESEQEQLERRIKELQADYEALTVAVGRVLDEKTSYVEANRRRLIKEADEQTEQARRASSNSSTSWPKPANSCVLSAAAASGRACTHGRKR